MKKKSTSRSAFFNLRVLIGLFVALTGVSLALLGHGEPVQIRVLAPPRMRAPHNHSSNTTLPPSPTTSNPLLPPGFDCSKIHQLGIDTMENFRAGT